MSDQPDESNSSRLNRRSVERLRERFGDDAMPELPVRAQLNPEDVPADLVELGAASHEGWHLDNCTDPAVDIHWSSHQAWVRATLAPVLAKLADDLDAEGDGMSENWTRARGIADGLHRAARRLRGDQS